MTRHQTTTIAGTEAAGRSLSPVYRRAWELFQDWCIATGRTALPADWDTVTEFVEAAGYSESTRRGQIAAIKVAHRAAGMPPPVRPTPSPEQRAATLAADRPDVTPLLAALPQFGWPAAIFARRDALLLTLWAAGATPKNLAALSGGNITIATPRRLSVHGLGTLPAASDPAVCPACIWLRWREVHHMIAAHAATWKLKKFLGERDAELPAADINHRCQTPTTTTDTGPAWPLFVPLDRWGNPRYATPDPATGRGLHGVVTAHATGQTAARVAAITAPEPEPEPQPAPTVPPLDPGTPARGLAARRHAVAELADADKKLASVERTAGELTGRIEQLLTYAAEDTNRPPP